jgi:hypothetical protein
MPLYLPPHVAEQERVRFQRRILRCTTTDDPRCQEYTTKLKHISPNLWMVRAQDTVDADLPLQPGYYHILEVNDHADMNVIVVQNNGEYVEPGDWIFDVLARGNLRERRVRDRLAEQEIERFESEEKRRATASEDRRERLKEVVLSATRAQVSMDRTIPWTQNVNGRRAT